MSKDNNIPRKGSIGVGRGGKPFKDGNVDENGDYIVGRGRTPDHTRFARDDGRKRGRRPKGTKNEKTYWEEELNELVTVTIDGKQYKLRKGHLLVKMALTHSIKGNMKAADLTFRRIDRHGIGEERTEGPALSGTDHEILSAFYQRMKQLEEGGDNDGT